MLGIATNTYPMACYNLEFLFLCFYSNHFDVEHVSEPENKFVLFTVYIHKYPTKLSLALHFSMTSYMSHFQTHVYNCLL